MSYPPRILVVDDDPAVRGWAMLALREHGFGIAGAADGGEALRAIAERTPDLVLLDLAMPVLDGPAVIERLQQTHADIPIVVMSHPDRARNAAEAHGIAGFLDKPFTAERLIAAVRGHLGGVVRSGSR